MSSHRIAVIAGDGIGTEVMPVGLAALDAAARRFGVSLQVDEFDFANCAYFARHGQTQANVERRFSGYKDTPLTALGLEQAAQVGRILKRELGMAEGYAFVSSPLARAVTTMKIARTAMGLPPDGFSTDNRLKEINLGSWDQLTDEEVGLLPHRVTQRRGELRETFGVGLVVGQAADLPVGVTIMLPPRQTAGDLEPIAAER